jgi:D-alanyl-lipoteichoic acid acyltransferase DltB (MBOAT superfamily)
MSLSDPAYIGFLFAVFVVYYLLRTGGQRRILLLAASYFFYFQLSHYYIAVLVGVTLITYLGAMLLGRCAGSPRRYPLFLLFCILMLAPLLAFKYLPSLLGLVHYHPPTGLGIDLASLVIPVGISFFTFTALGYLFDVYLEVIDPEPRLDRVALFLAFFPLVSAGPIERAQGLMPQLSLDQSFSCSRSISALRTIVLGLVMKVFIAGFLAGPVNTVYAAPGSYPALDQFLATVDYAFFIYSDFAGYTLIAIGSARLLGLEVMPNFAQPFLSKTIPEFWQRWHMSLSFWVRDYVFAPLWMNWRRFPKTGMPVAVLLAFTIIGVWHGAKWGYLFFGLLHGTYAVVSNFTLKKRNAFWTRAGLPAGVLVPTRTLITFALVLIGFVLFRAENMPDALVIYRSVFSLEFLKESAAALHSLALHPAGQLAGSSVLEIKKCIGLFVILIAGDLIARRKLGFVILPAALQLAIVDAGILLILSCWIMGRGSAPFVYYKF